MTEKPRKAQLSAGSPLTFGGEERAALLSGGFQGEGDAQELQVAVAVPHQQLLAWLDVFAGLVEDLCLHLHGDQVLLIREAGALDQSHPVPRSPSAVHEVAQLAVFEHLPAETRTRELRKGFQVSRAERRALPPTSECCRRRF